MFLFLIRSNAIGFIVPCLLMYNLSLYKLNSIWFASTSVLSWEIGAMFFVTLLLVTREKNYLVVRVNVLSDLCRDTKLIYAMDVVKVTRLDRLVEEGG